MLKTFVNRTLFFVLGAAMFSTPLKAGEADIAGQVERGRQLFVKSVNGASCSTCHAIEGKGNAVGPDLKTLGSVVGPRGMMTTIMMSVTCYVQEYSMVNGASFQGIEKSKAKGTVEVWDLTSTPAQLRTLKEGEFTVKPNTKWKHPPTGMGLEDQGLADLIAYIKAAATGTAKEVKVEELH